jgi:hypothetical protein
VCQDAAYQLIEFPEQDMPDDLRQQVGQAARRVALCVGQQMLAADPSIHPRTKRRVVARLLHEAGYTEAGYEQRTGITRANGAASGGRRVGS